MSSNTGFKIGRAGSSNAWLAVLFMLVQGESIVKYVKESCTANNLTSRFNQGGSENKRVGNPKVSTTQSEILTQNGHHQFCVKIHQIEKHNQTYPKYKQFGQPKKLINWLSDGVLGLEGGVWNFSAVCNPKVLLVKVFSSCHWKWPTGKVILQWKLSMDHGGQGRCKNRIAAEQYWEPDTIYKWVYGSRTMFEGSNLAPLVLPPTPRKMRHMNMCSYSLGPGGR